MKAIIVGLLLIIVGLGWGVYTDASQLQQLQSKYDALKAQAAEPRTASLAQQAQCEQQAVNVFHSLGYSERPTKDSSDSYQSHYNPKLGKCFVAINSINFNVGPQVKQQFNSVLLDAYEQREYAVYTWFSSDKPMAQTPPFICKTMASSVAPGECTSDAEYKAFIAQYME